MEFIERCPLKELHYLLNMKFNTYKVYVKNDCSNDDERLKYYEKMKQMAKSLINTNGEIKRLYKFTGGNDWGDGSGSGRLFAIGNSIQGLHRYFRGFLLRNSTTDIDMVNCHCVLLQYLCKIHNIKHTELTYYIDNRDDILAAYPDREKAKRMYLIAVNKDELNKKETDKNFKAFDKECKVIQEQLTKLPCYANIVKDIPEHKIYNWYGSAINRILCYYENRVLQIIINHLNKKNIEIAAPMFDGAMIYGNFYDDMTLIREIEQDIKDVFPEMNMKLSYKQHNAEIQLPEDYEIPVDEPKKNVRYADCDYAACEYIFEEVKSFLISYKGRLFYKSKHIWINDKNKIDDIILTYITKSNIYKPSDDGDIPYCQNVKNAKNIRDLLYAQIRTNNENHTLYDNFHHVTKDRLFFLDGVLDFKAKKFYTWEEVKQEDDFSCVQINRNYANYFKNPDQKIMDYIESNIIEPMFGDKMPIFLHLIARALAGHYEDKLWATYLGNRNCGKGVLYDLLKYAFGDYVSTFEIGNLMYKYNTNSTSEDSKKLYWTIDLEFVRLAMSQETPDHKTGLKLDSRIVKKIGGGGDDIIAKRNYDRVDTIFKMETFLFMAGNSSIDVDNEDCNEQRIEFNSVNQFKTQEEIDALRDSLTPEELSRYRIKNPDIKSLCKTEDFMNAMVYLLFKNFKNEAVIVPKKSVDEEDTGLIGVLKDKLQFTNKSDDYELCSTIYQKIDFDKGKITNELNSRNIFKKKLTSGPDKSKYAFIGIKLIRQSQQSQPIGDEDIEELDELK